MFFSYPNTIIPYPLFATLVITFSTPETLVPAQLSFIQDSASFVCDSETQDKISFRL